MQSLPNELIPIIVDYITLITDKRQFAKTCKSYNVIAKEIIENNDLYIKFPQFYKLNKYCIENFMLELCHDSYFDLIPPSYMRNYNKYIVPVLARFGGFKLLKKFVKNYYNINKSYCDVSSVLTNAVIGGHLDIVIWARLYGCEWYEATFISAAEYGHLHIIKYLSKHMYSKSIELCPSAALHGHLDILIWAKDHGFRCNENICRNAAIGGHLEILKWAINNKCYFDESIVYYFAAHENKLNIIKWMHENNYEWDYKTCNGAAENGNLELLKWLMENGCGFIEDICSSAAKSGNLDMLKWLKEIGCKLNQEVCTNATMKRHLHIIEWAIENGCELNESILDIALKRGFGEIISWIKEMNIQNDILFIKKLKY